MKANGYILMRIIKFLRKKWNKYGKTNSERSPIPAVEVVINLSN